MTFGGHRFINDVVIQLLEGFDLNKIVNKTVNFPIKEGDTVQSWYECRILMCTVSEVRENQDGGQCRGKGQRTQVASSL